MIEGISEAASENAVKRRRGRPKLFDEFTRTWTPGTEAKTERGKMEALYARSAARILFDHRHEHPELTEWTGLYQCENGKECIDWGSLKITVLAELGRLIEKYQNGEEVAVRWSVQILNMAPKPSVKQAMLMLRAWRLGQERKAGATDALTCKILASIDSYTDSHPGTTNQQIIDALEQAIGIHFAYSDDEQEQAR
jgi:hypothetical protein